MHDFSLTAKMMNMEQFLSAAQEKGVLKPDEVASWQQELKTAMRRDVYLCRDDVCGNGEEVRGPGFGSVPVHFFLTEPLSPLCTQYSV